MEDLDQNSKTKYHSHGNIQAYGQTSHINFREDILLKNALAPRKTVL